MQEASATRHASNFTHRLFADQVQKQYEHTFFGTAATLINGLIMAFVLQAHVPFRSLMFWLLCAGVVSAARLVLQYLYNHSATRFSNPAMWNLWFIVTLFLAGLLWGSTVIFLFPYDSIGHQAFLALVTGGMAAGALAAFTAVIAAFFIFSIPAVVPICLRFLTLGGEVHFAMGAMSVLFLVIISLTALRMHKDILHLLALKYERITLIADLQQEVDRRKQAQESLRRQKAKVEEIVMQRTAQLAQSEEKYRELVENINDVLYAVDRQGIITYISPVIESVLGYRSDDLIGNCFLDYVYLQDRPRLESDFAKALEITGEPREYRFLDKCGETRWCRVSSRVISENNEKPGIQGVLVDISRSKQLEEQLQRAQKMEALGTLAGGVAHDLNNILTGIVSYPELLLMDVPEESPLWHPLNTIKKSGENAAAIVQDLLTLARRGVATLELVNLNQIVKECLDSPEIKALLRQHANVRLTLSLAPDLFNVYGSAVHIYKSFLNLILNAVEAMPKGGSLEIATDNRYADKVISGFDTIREGEYVVLSIADSGIGIAERDQARIFEPFYTRKVLGRSGSGLGMAVVWGTVKDHNGYIDMRSEEGQGTRFELIFPATRDQLDKRRTTEGPSDFTGNGEFILIVDDMPTQREIASSILERLGYRCQAVSSGEQAVEFLREHPADLVVLDMIMTPGMDGYETYRRILSIRPGQKAIMASGYSETDRVREAQQLGAGRYIKKPYTLTAIGKAIKEELQRA